MFTKETTKQIKGIAILYMLMHHLYRFPDRIPFGLSVATNIRISEMELTMILGTIGKACVVIFMFLGGYGLYCVYMNNGEKTFGKKVVQLYRNYWKVFLVIVPIGFLFFGNQNLYCENSSLCVRFSNFSVSQMFSSFIGYNCVYNDEWWFFKAYLFALFEGFIFIELFKNRQKMYSEIGAVIVWNILITKVFPSCVQWGALSNLIDNDWFTNLCTINDSASLLLVGIVFAKYRIFELWGEMLGKLSRAEKVMLSILGIVIIAYVRVFVIHGYLDIAVIPAYIFFMAILVNEVHWLAKLLQVFGKYSTPMWLLHSFFIYYFGSVAKFIYGTGNFVVAFLLLVIITLLSAMAVEWMWKGIGLIYAKAKGAH